MADIRATEVLIRDDITVTQPVDLDTIGADLLDNQSHRLSDGLPSAITDHTDIETRYVDIELGQNFSAGDAVRIIDDAGPKLYNLLSAQFHDVDFNDSIDAGTSIAPERHWAIAADSQGRILNVYWDGATSDFKYRIGTITNGDLVWSSPSSVPGTALVLGSNTVLSLNYMPSEDCFILYNSQNSSVANYPTIGVARIDSLTTASFGNYYVIASATGAGDGQSNPYIPILEHPNSSNQAVVFYKQITGAIVKGDVITFDRTALTLTQDNSNDLITMGNSFAGVGGAVWDTLAQRFLILVWEFSGVAYQHTIKALAASISGNVITPGTAVTVQTPVYRSSNWSFGHMLSVAYQPVEGTSVIVFIDGMRSPSGRDEAYAVGATISGSTVNLGSIVPMTDPVGYGYPIPAGGGIDVVNQPNNEILIVHFYPDWAPERMVMFSDEVTISGNTVTFNDNPQISQGAESGMTDGGGWGTFHDVISVPTTDRILCAYPWWTNYTYISHHYAIYDVYPETNLDKFVGILQESGNTGEVKKVALIGSISRAHSGLIPGEYYYLQEDASIDTLSSAFAVGYARNSTDLVISGTKFGQTSISITSLQISDFQNAVDNSTHALSVSNPHIVRYQQTWNTYVAIADPPALPNDEILADSSGGSFNITMPSSPTIGQRFRVVDAKGTFGTYPVTILRNGQPLKGVADDLVCDLDGMIIDFYYTDATYGWTFKVNF